MKIETFLFQGEEITTYIPERDRRDRRLDLALDATVIDETINNFIKDKKVISISQNSFVQGNNPPSTILIYTVIYEDK